MNSKNDFPVPPSLQLHRQTSGASILSHSSLNVGGNLETVFEHPNDLDGDDASAKSDSSAWITNMSNPMKQALQDSVSFITRHHRAPQQLVMNVMEKANEHIARRLAQILGSDGDSPAFDFQDEDFCEIMLRSETDVEVDDMEDLETDEVYVRHKEKMGQQLIDLEQEMLKSRTIETAIVGYGLATQQAKTEKRVCDSRIEGMRNIIGKSEKYINKKQMAKTTAAWKKILPKNMRPWAGDFPKHKVRAKLNLETKEQWKELTEHTVAVKKKLMEEMGWEYNINKTDNFKHKTRKNISGRLGQKQSVKEFIDDFKVELGFSDVVSTANPLEAQMEALQTQLNALTEENRLLKRSRPTEGDDKEDDGNSKKRARKNDEHE